MASFNSLQHTHLCFESPAKVFARLKSKVQMEAMNAKQHDFKGNDPLLSVRDKHGAAFHSPWRKSTNTVDKCRENKRANSYYDEAQALTLSPISSPQKPRDYSSLRETSPMTDLYGYKRKRRDGAFMESTSVSQTISSVSRDHIRQRTPQIWDSRVLSRTPVKRQSVEDMGRSVSDKRATPLVSLERMFTPIRNRLRERKLDQQEFNYVTRTTEERVEDARGVRRSFSTEDYTHNNTSILAGGLPADQSEMLHQPKTPQSRSALTKHCRILLERLPIASPAKMFAYMKERETKGEKTNVHNSRRELTGNVQESSDTSPSTARSMDEMEEDASADAPETTDPVNRDREDSADSCSETGGAEDVQVPATPKHPILLEDPLVLNTPQISIPKKDKDVFKRSLWINQEEFPAESVIYLKNWSLGRNPKGLFVTGIHRSDNVLWNSSFIVDRLSPKVLKTVSGRVYVLVGKMKMHRDSDLPKSFLKRFENGFPLSWKTLHEKMMSEHRKNETRKNKAKDVTSASPPEASINQSVKRRRQDSFRTPDSCPPASSTMVSRSGRVIKPPLEYWRGGRVTLDVDMNVTIHECYDTSDTSSIASLRQSQKPAHVQPRRKDSKKTEKEEASQLVRKVGALQNQNKSGVSRDKKPGNSFEPTREMFEIPKRPPGKTRSSSQRLPHTRGTYEDGGLQRRGEPETSSTQRPLKQADGTKRYSMRATSRKQISPSSTENSSSPSSSDEEFPKKRRKQKKRATSKKGVIVSNKTQADRNLLSSKKSREEPKQRGRTRRSDEAKQEEEDENGWTKMELMKLKEAVSFYPENITGFWTKVARMVGTRSAEECHKQHVSKGARQSPERCTKKPKKKKVEEPKPPERPVVSARVGTLKRKQQVRQFLEAVPRDVDDAFSSAYMQNQRVEVPSMCLNNEHECTMSNLGPQTPMSSRFPEVKTPQCLHITPGMIGSPNTKNDDKAVYQMQKKIKKNQFNACRMTRTTKFTTPSVKRSVQRCTVENNNFAVWEMFPGNDEGLSDSDEQEDFYFSDT